MKKSILPTTVLLGFVFILFIGCGEKLKTFDDKASYALGITIGKTFNNDKILIDIDLSLKGITDVLEKEKSFIDFPNMQNALIEFQGNVTKNNSEPFSIKDFQPSNDFKTSKEFVSYAIGMSIGENFKFQHINLIYDKFKKGLKTGMNNLKALMSEEEIKDTLDEFQKKIREELMEERKKTAEENKKLESEFLAKNKQEKDVITLDNGLQYKILKKGNGESPTINDKVTCHYEGSLLDGTVFDSSYKRNEPATFPLNGVIKGWQEILPLMKINSKWQIWIPADLGYGENGAGAMIPPSATLTFEIELLKIN